MSSQSQSQHQTSDPERGSGPGQGGIPQGNSNKLQDCYARLPKFLQKPLEWMSDKFDIESNWGRGLYIAAYMIVILMHPLHYYSYVIIPDQNCLEIDNYIYNTIAVVIFFNAYMLLYTPNFLKKLYLDGRGSKKTAIEHFIFTQIPVLLMTLTVLPDLTTGTKTQIFLTTANLFLFGYILLVIGLSLTLKNATGGTGYIARAKWAKAAYSLFLYLLGGHVFGALWYSFAVDRILACWREDYFSRNNFNPHSFVCRDKHKNIGELNCPKIKKIVSEITGFGIFNEALQSGIVELKRHFLKKILYCFRWGLQALSCFGQNLSPSTFIMENIFVVSVVIYSTLLFVFLIGNMQEYLKHEDKKEEQLFQVQEQLFQVQEQEQPISILQKQLANQYVSFARLPEELQMEVINNLQLNKWRETKILHMKTLFNIQDLLRDIKIELCLPQLRNVKEFQELGEPALKDLCYKVKLVFYPDRTLIVRKDDPIKEMLFVLHGVLRTYNSRSTYYYLKDGEFFGKELVTWVNNSSRLPISQETVEAFTNVEAFVLMAYDWKKINKENCLR